MQRQRRRKGRGPYRADIIATDRDRHPVLLVEVKGYHPSADVLEQLRRYLVAGPAKVPFGMIVTPSEIIVFDLGDTGAKPIVRLDTREILRKYDAEFGKKRVFETYLISLVESWLRDLAYRWKWAEPPGSEQLKRIGLAGQLQEGTTVTEVERESTALP